METEHADTPESVPESPSELHKLRVKLEYQDLEIQTYRRLLEANGVSDEEEHRHVIESTQKLQQWAASARQDLAGLGRSHSDSVTMTQLSETVASIATEAETLAAEVSVQCRTASAQAASLAEQLEALQALYDQSVARLVDSSAAVSDQQRQIASVSTRLQSLTVQELKLRTTGAPSAAAAEEAAEALLESHTQKRLVLVREAFRVECDMLAAALQISTQHRSMLEEQVSELAAALQASVCNTPQYQPPAVGMYVCRSEAAMTRSAHSKDVVGVLDPGGTIEVVEWTATNNTGTGAWRGCVGVLGPTGMWISLVSSSGVELLSKCSEPPQPGVSEYQPSQGADPVPAVSTVNSEAEFQLESLALVLAQVNEALREKTEECATLSQRLATRSAVPAEQLVTESPEGVGDVVVLPATPKGAPGELAPEWHEFWDEASARPYYYNERLGESSWERPEATRAVRDRSASAPVDTNEYYMEDSQNEEEAEPAAQEIPAVDVELDPTPAEAVTPRVSDAHPVEPEIRRLFQFQERVLGVSHEETQDIDRRLVKKLIIEYLSNDKNQEMAELMARILGLNDDERRKAKLLQPGSSWLPGFLRSAPAMPESTPGDVPPIKQLWIDFLLNEAGLNSPSNGAAAEKSGLAANGLELEPGAREKEGMAASGVVGNLLEPVMVELEGTTSLLTEVLPEDLN